MYRGLDLIQYTDGKDIVNINRDDASGFRLDTLATYRQYATPAVKGEFSHHAYGLRKKISQYSANYIVPFCKDKDNT